jgi:hypothetical protein
MMQLSALSVLCALCIQLACAFTFLGAPTAPVSAEANVQQRALMSAREPSATTPVAALHKRLQAGGFAAAGALASAQIALADVIDTDEVNSLSVDAYRTPIAIPMCNRGSQVTSCVMCPLTRGLRFPEYTQMAVPDELLPPMWVPLALGVVLLAGIGAQQLSLGNVMDEEAKLGGLSGARAAKQGARGRSMFNKKK